MRKPGEKNGISSASLCATSASAHTTASVRPSSAHCVASCASASASAEPGSGSSAARRPASGNFGASDGSVVNGDAESGTAATEREVGDSSAVAVPAIGTAGDIGEILWTEIIRGEYAI